MASIKDSGYRDVKVNGTRRAAPIDAKGPFTLENTIPYRQAQKLAEVGQYKPEVLKTAPPFKEDTIASREIRQLAQYSDVTNRMREGESYSNALKHAHMSRDVFERINDSQGNFVGSTNVNVPGKAKRRFLGKYTATWVIPAFGDNGNSIIRELEVDRPMSSLIGKYYNAVDAALKGDSKALQRFKGVIIRDINGNTYELVTDLNLILAWMDDIGVDSTNFYEIIYPSKRGIMSAA